VSYRVPEPNWLVSKSIRLQWDCDIIRVPDVVAADVVVVDVDAPNVVAPLADASFSRDSKSQQALVRYFLTHYEIRESITVGFLYDDPHIQ